MPEDGMPRFSVDLEEARCVSVCLDCGGLQLKPTVRCGRCAGTSLCDDPDFVRDYAERFIEECRKHPSRVSYVLRTKDTGETWLMRPVTPPE